MLQIKDIFQLNSLKKAKLLAAKNYDSNSIERVNIMDAPDINDWIKENELVLTSGFAIFKNITNMEEMIKGLAAANCAGLGIKLNRFFNKIPDSIIKFGEKFGLPIIEIPKDINLGDVVEEILIEISIKYELDEINMVPMLNKCLQSQNIDQIIKLIGRILNKNIYLESVFLDEPLLYLFDLKINDWNEIYSLSDQLLETKKSFDYNIYQLDKKIKNYKYKLEFKIRQNDYSLASLVILNQDKKLNDSKEIAVINFCLNLLSFLLNKKRLSFQNTHDLENKIIYNLINKKNNDYNKLTKQLRILNINVIPKKTYLQVIVIDILMLKKSKKEIINKKLKKIVDKLKNEIKYKKNLKTLIGIYQNKIMIIVMNENKSNNNQLTTLINLINNLINDQFSVGISKKKKKFIKIKELYLQALKALDIAKERTDNIFKYRDIGVLGDIYDLNKDQSLKKIAENNLASILNHENCDEYIQTLEKYFQNNEKSQETAAALGIHRNTLKYRLDKIEKLTQKSINNLEDKFKLYTGIKAYNLLK